ncbi:MAG: hypothetical protein L0G87_15065 [Renibacterium salmoninarum]|nr:hypothetical protein [Renibacterium salmoninarum]
MADPDEHRFYVYFQQGAAALPDAVQALTLHDLSAGALDSVPESFSVVAEGLEFVVTLDESAAAAQHARAMAEQTGFRGLADCDARFAVEVADLPAALSEINTMMELQGALQDCCNGYVVLAWNDGVVEPWTVES